MVACELSRRHPTEALRCPRCDSSDTKFCYFNNYNTSQPRHFCKSCKRYWTAGGSLRNVPVGGGLRKNKKSKLLSQVKDVVSSSSSDELLQNSSLAATAPYAFPKKNLQYDSPIPLSFAPPLFMTAPSSSPELAGDSTLGNPYAFRSLNQLSYGFFAENRMDDYASTVDPSLLNPMSVRQQAHCPADYVRTLPEGLQLQWNGDSHVPLAPARADQAQSHSGCISEVPSEASQASFEVIKDAQAPKCAELRACPSDQAPAPEENLSKVHRDTCADASVTNGQASIFQQLQAQTQENLIEGAGPGVDNQLRDVSSTEEDDELGNVVNVRYPYDWEQVSEVLFGGATDFFQLSGY